MTYGYKNIFEKPFRKIMDRTVGVFIISAFKAIDGEKGCAYDEENGKTPKLECSTTRKILVRFSHFETLLD